MPTLPADVRPSGINLMFRPGDPAELLLEWPTGFLTGRTWASTLGAQTLDVQVTGDDMIVTADSTDTTAVGLATADWVLRETTSGIDVNRLIGRWTGSEKPSKSHGGPLQVIVDGVTVDVTVAASLSIDHPLIFWQHPVAQTIPNAAWTPIAWNTLNNTVGDGWTSYVAASTSVAVGSNGAVLPQGAINVADTTGFAAAGYLVVRISGTDRVIAYTGNTATSFTGCTLGVGTLATGQTVAQANVEFNLPVDTVGPLVAELAWASNATGLRGTRIRSLNALGAGIHLNAATDVRAAGVASADPMIRSIAVEQPAFSGAGLPYRIEGYQSSTGNLDTMVDQLAAPRLVIQSLSGFAL